MMVLTSLTPREIVGMIDIGLVIRRVLLVTEAVVDPDSMLLVTESVVVPVW